MESLEIEFKSLLTKTDYEKLLAYFSLSEKAPFWQENFYFDTPQQNLKQLHFSLRVRQFSTCGEQTLKVPQKCGKLEITDPLTEAEVQDLVSTKKIKAGGVVEKRLAEEAISLKDLAPFGHLKTLRHEVSLPIGLLAIDESHYEGKTDYELEMEVSDFSTGKKDFFQLLADLEIPYRKATSKIQRLVTCLNEKT